jgi:exodeoxyribonuclease-3
MVKIVSWNVNGIRAVWKKGFVDFVKAENPDILCIQETKAHPDQVDQKLSEYKYHFWNSAEKKGYAGTAIFSKVEPLSVKYNFGIKENHQEEGRIITLEFKDFYLLTVYTPNSGRGLVRLNYRKEWDDLFLNYVQALEKIKPVVICGDLNVAHTEIDLANPKSNYNKTAGYTQVEIDGLQRLLDAGYIDSFREFVKEKGHYTFWSQMFNARARNVGWRIDYFLISEKLRSKLKKSFILPSVMGSDHCPVGLELKE